MKRTSQPCALTLFLWLSVVTAPAGAETVYVADRFEIGVHESTNFDSVIVAVIPSGTSLEVITRDGEFVEVRTPDSTRGWVDARYVVSEKPSVALLEERDDELREAEQSLGTVRAEVEVLRQRITELRRDAATAARISPGVATAVPLAPNEDSAKLEQARRERANLAEENRQLKIHIADMEALQIASAMPAANSESKEKQATAMEGGGKGIWRGSLIDAARTWTRWHWLLLGSALLLAFTAGGYVVDWWSRRRHGGFRL